MSLVSILLFLICLVLLFFLYQNREEINNLKNEKNNLSKELEEKKIDLVKKEAELDILNKNKDYQDKILEQQKMIFQNLSNDALKEQNKIGREEITKMLEPFNESLKACKKGVDTMNLETKTAIEEKIKSIFDYTQKVGESADRLAKAFEGDKKAQGNFGELKLENLLNYFGFKEGIDYIEQCNLKENQKDLYPDFILQVQKGRWLVIDSKFSLSNYEKYINTKDEDKENKEAFLKAYFNDLKNRVNELGKKEYHKILKENGKETFDFSCLFFGNENAYMSVIANSEYRAELYKLTAEKKVAIVTASSIAPVLQITRQIWSIENMNTNMKSCIKEIDTLRGKLFKFLETFEKIGSSIKSSSNAYEDAFKYLKGGNANIIKTIESIEQIERKIKNDKEKKILDFYNGNENYGIECSENIIDNEQKKSDNNE